MTETSEPIPAPVRKVAANTTPASDGLCHDWTRDVIAAFLELPFKELLFQALVVHRRRFGPNKVQLSRFCMGAAWRESKRTKDIDGVVEFVTGIMALGMEPFMTLGMSPLTSDG